MNKILLVDVDSKIPNIALGKLSTYHKNQGDSVKFLQLHMRGVAKNVSAKIIDCVKYDKVYVSNIFTYNQKHFRIINCDDVSIGGVGSVNPLQQLPPEIDDAEVDYTLWPENEFSYGFITRGCIRKCKFCFVPKIEGKIRFYSSVEKIVKHKKVIFLDNNILAYRGHVDILKEIRDRGIICQFNQGLDIRLITDENAKVLSEIKYHAKYIFAYDSLKYSKAVERGTKIFQKYVPGKWAMRFLIYYNANDKLGDLMYRINWAKRHYVSPYLMRDANCVQSLYRDFLSALAGYIGGHGGEFYKMTFGQYQYKTRYYKNERIRENILTYIKANRGEI